MRFGPFFPRMTRCGIFLDRAFTLLETGNDVRGPCATSQRRLMSIRVTCPSCGETGHARDEYEGKRVICPKCGHSFVLGSESPLEHETWSVARSIPRDAELNRKHDDEYEDTVVCDRRQKVPDANADK